jgi:hypothetical protein
MSIKRLAIAGAATGLIVAIVLMSLSAYNLYPLNGFVERLTFALCPLYILGFAPVSWFTLIGVVLLSNALLYGVGFGIVGVAIEMFKRVAAGPKQ